MNATEEMQSTGLYKQIDDLVRHHDSREPYITNTVIRIYLLVRDGVQQNIDRDANYKKGYQAGYQAGTKKATK